MLNNILQFKLKLELNFCQTANLPSCQTGVKVLVGVLIGVVGLLIRLMGLVLLVIVPTCQPAKLSNWSKSASMSTNRSSRVINRTNRTSTISNSPNTTNITSTSSSNSQPDHLTTSQPANLPNCQTGVKVLV